MCDWRWYTDLLDIPPVRFASDGGGLPKVMGNTPLLTAMIHGVAPVVIEYGDNSVFKIVKRGQKRPPGFMFEGPSLCVYVAVVRF